MWHNATKHSTCLWLTLICYYVYLCGPQHYCWYLLMVLYAEVNICVWLMCWYPNSSIFYVMMLTLQFDWCHSILLITKSLRFLDNLSRSYCGKSSFLLHLLVELLLSLVLLDLICGVSLCSALPNPTGCTFFALSLSSPCPLCLSTHHYAFWQISIAVHSACNLPGIFLLSPYHFWDSLVQIRGVAVMSYWPWLLCVWSLSFWPCSICCSFLIYAQLWFHGSLSSHYTFTVDHVVRKGIFTWVSASPYDWGCLVISALWLLS